MGLRLDRAPCAYPPAAAGKEAQIEVVIVIVPGNCVNFRGKRRFRSLLERQNLALYSLIRLQSD